MAERTVVVKLDKTNAREVDQVVERARARRPDLTRAQAVNELVSRAVRDRRYLRAIGDG